jgi:diguanylate cyclase (GGDEF)-like protein
MFPRFRKGSKTEPARRPLPSRKTTEIITTPRDGEVLGRSRISEPALILLEGEMPGQVFRIRLGRQIIGRRPECEIRLRERAVSGIHAEVLRDASSVVINDLASTNGTLVNGVAIRGSVPLTQNSLIRIGNCVFKYVDSLLDVEFLESLHAKAITDQLTGTFNQSYLVARLAHALDTADEERPVSVIAFDFDDFKLVNDHYGHAAGDQVLRESCALIRDNAVRRDDLFARMGGEEFAIVLPNTHGILAREIADRVRSKLDETTFDYNGTPIHVTASLGVATSHPGVTPEALLETADELLYRSKHAGRNRVTGEDE